jgi:hypothetical protein
VTRDRRPARVLGLWTAGWLAVFLLVGMFWLGEPSVQWPVLVVPLLWALVALRPRRRPPAPDEDGWDDDGWDDDRPPETPEPPGGYRTDTVERPAVRPPWETGHCWDG